MSGHSHWAGIKHKKGIEDAKRSKVFTKLGSAITIAAREKGGNPDMNPTLRIAVEKARASNMPSENIERAIKRGTGEGEGVSLEGFLYEAFGPAGAAFLIEGITDNKNRTLSEVRKIITSAGGRMAEQGAVSWMFDRKGFLRVEAPSGMQADEAQLAIIDAGADDVESTVEGILVYTAPDKVMDVKKKLEAAKFAVSETGFDYVPKTPVSVSDEKSREALIAFFETLDDHDDVQEVYTNSR